MTIGNYAIGEKGIGDTTNPGIINIPHIVISTTLYTPDLGASIIVPSLGITLVVNSPSIKTTVFSFSSQPNAISENAIGVAGIGEGKLVGAATAVISNYEQYVITYSVPIITAGTSILPSNLNVVFSTYDPNIAISATVSVETLPIGVVFNSPNLEFAVHIPLVSYSITLNALNIYAGKQLVLSGTINNAVTFNVPNIYSGKQIVISDYIPITIITHNPLVKTGLAVKAWNTTTIQVLRGSIGDSTISRIPIGGSVVDERIDTYSNRIDVNIYEPIIYAGKTIKPDAINIQFLPQALEISARGRRVKAQFIAY